MINAYSGKVKQNHDGDGTIYHGLVQERCNSKVLALTLRYVTHIYNNNDTQKELNLLELHETNLIWMQFPHINWSQLYWPSTFISINNKYPAVQSNRSGACPTNSISIELWFLLTLKRLGHFFSKVILFSNVVQH